MCVHTWQKGIPRTQIKSETRDVITDTRNTKSYKGPIYEQLYVNKLDNLEKADKFSMLNLQNINHYERKNLKRSVT